MDKKWIKFVLEERKSPVEETTPLLPFIKGEQPKKQVWNIVSKEDNLILGYISWFPRWRKYAFFPNNNMVFDTACLKDITAFIENLRK